MNVMGTMKKLFLQTRDGNVQIDPAFVEKYNLKAGDLSPFSRELIVDENGKVPTEKEAKGSIKNVLGEESTGELVNDGISVLGNGVTMSTSEIIDISQGVDSQME
jgi:hypothetical protein